MRCWIPVVSVIAMLLSVSGGTRGTPSSPVADFRMSPHRVFVSSEVHFADQSLAEDGAIRKWEWQFGDGASSTVRHPVHSYAQPGVFLVKLTVTSPEGSSVSVKSFTVTDISTAQPPDASKEGTRQVRIQLSPTGPGSRIRIARPDDPEVGFTLWAPEGVSYPVLDQGGNELLSGPIDWQRDEASGTLYYAISRKEGTLEAFFVPYEEHVDCFYVVRPSAGYTPPPDVFVNPCQQMLDGVFEGDDIDLLNRMWFVSKGTWVSIGSCPEAGRRNDILGSERPIQRDLEPTLHRIASHPWDTALLACASRDAKWMSATATESGTYLFNNALPGFRCMHTAATVPLRTDGPTVVRTRVYLFRGSLDTLRTRYEQTVRDWAACSPATLPTLKK
jgi:hypothetical protein